MVVSTDDLPAMETQQMRFNRNSALLLSTVTPVYRGEKYLRELVKLLADLRERFLTEGWPIALAESIFVDDGSVDQSSKLLSELEKEFDWVKVIYLSRNYGQHPATVAGILHSSGDWIATLDEDLQHLPAHLSEMFRQVAERGVDVVYANPLKPVHGSILRDGASRLYKMVLSRLSGNPTVRKFNSFRLIRGSIARAAAAVSSYDTYFDIALGWFSSRIGDIKLNLADLRYQESGKSGYSWWQLMQHARRMLTSSQVKLLRLGTIIGVLSLLASAALIAFLVFTKYFYPETVNVLGWTTLAIGILFYGGLTACLIGICLEYIAILIHRAQGRPTFLTIDRAGDQALADWFARH